MDEDLRSPAVSPRVMLGYRFSSFFYIVLYRPVVFKVFFLSYCCCLWFLTPMQCQGSNLSRYLVDFARNVLSPSIIRICIVTKLLNDFVYPMLGLTNIFCVDALAKIHWHRYSRCFSSFTRKT